MSDDFSGRYGDLLAGSYDCVDRIVVKAYFPVGRNPGGFRFCWRQWHDGSDDQLDNAPDADGRPVRPPGQGVGAGQ